MFGDPDNGERAAAAFCAWTQGRTTPGRLQYRGKQAMEWRHGCLLDPTEKGRLLYNDSNEVTNILRDVKPHWDAIDGTHMRSATQIEDGRLIGPDWDGSASCAVDVAVWLCLCLDAGRIQIDQITSKQRVELSDVQALVRLIGCSSWSALTQETRNERRDELQVALRTRLSRRPGRYLPISGVMEACLKGLPQFEYTRGLAWVCCDGKPVLLKRDGRLRRCESVSVVFAGSETLEQAVNRHFGWTTDVTLNDFPFPDRRCSSKAKCTRTHRRRAVVLDRLPPSLYVQISADTQPNEALQRGMFEDMSVVTLNPRGERVAHSYKAVGCVCIVMRNHFTARWRIEGGGVYAYDGQRFSGMAQKVTDGDMYRSLRAKDSVCAVVFRLSALPLRAVSAEA